MVIWMTGGRGMTKQAMKMGILNNMALPSYKLGIWQSIYRQKKRAGNISIGQKMCNNYQVKIGWWKIGEEIITVEALLS